MILSCPHERERDKHERSFVGEYPFAFPYSYVAQKIVAEIINPQERGCESARAR
jgi:hypothetical protein